MSDHPQGPAQQPGPGGGNEHAPDRRLRRHQRLTRPRDFQETYAQGRRWVGSTMVLWLRTGEGSSMRLGVVASRKVGNAVKRARAKRRLREVFRTHRSLFKGDVDVVLVARAAIIKAPWANVVDDFLKLSRQAGIQVEEESTSHHA